MASVVAAWPMVALGELLRLERRPAKIAPDAEYAEIGIYSYGRGIFHKTPRAGLEVGNKELFLIQEGDFIFQITFAWEGAIALASQAEHGMYGSVRFPTYRVNEQRCHAPFLLNYFRTVQGREQLIRLSPGSAGRNRVLNLRKLPEVTIPLPPLDEQRRIVARIEELATRIEEARGLRREATAEGEALCRSILFHDATALQPVVMYELVRGRSTDVEVQADESYQFAGVFSFGRGVFPGQQKTGQEFAYSRLTRLHTGDLVYPKLMAWEGAIGIVPAECDGLVVSPEFPVFEVRQEHVLPEVLDVYFRTPSVWPTLSGASTGTNVRRRRLHPNEFLQLRFPLPPMPVQRRLREVCNRLKEASTLQERVSQELEAVVPAVLDRAFRGEL